MKEKTVDMTQGPILSRMIRFALPVLLGMLCQRIYNFADVYIVGRYLGDDALAAVSIAGTGTYLLFSVMMGLTTGVSVVISQYYGAGEKEKVSETFSTSIYVAVVASVIVTILGILGTKPFLHFLHTPEELLPQATVYLTIMFIGAAGTMLYNWISSVLRSLGNSLVPLIFLIISSILNVILDIAFVVWIPMGVAGAALATVAAQVFSGALCLIYAWKILPLLHFGREKLRCNMEIVKQILIYGIPTGLQMCIICTSDIVLQGKVNTYGTALVVAYGVCMKVEGLGWQLAEAIGMAMGTFAGQNVGAQKYDRVRKGVRAAYLINFVCYGLFAPLVFAFAPQIMRAFTSNPDSVRYGVEYMRTFSMFFFIGGNMTIYHNILRAAGDIKVTILMGVSEVITRITFTFLFTGWMGYQGLWWVSPLTWCCAVAVGAVRYYSGKWEEKARRQKIQTA